ncbi:hypothetical protein ACHAQJ_006297 [Trichoderma viride]
MKFFAIAALFAAAAVAQPLEARTGSGSICPPGLFSNPQCCATQVLGIIGLDCSVPNKTPHDGANFKKICSDKGDQALCCVAPIAGQSLLCQPAIGAQ